MFKWLPILIALAIISLFASPASARLTPYGDFSAKASTTQATGGDLTAAFAQTRARFRFFSYDADWLYSPERIETMAIAAQAAGRDAVHHKIHAPLGHDAFLIQRDPQTELICQFLM